MKSVGEVMAIGRSFAESLQKALRGLETGLTGLDRVRELENADEERIESALGAPDARTGCWSPRRRFARDSRSSGSTISGFDPWFVRQLARSFWPRWRFGRAGCPTTPPGCGG
jgi:carbamoyl-phosphate synthase large subunit